MQASPATAPVKAPTTLGLPVRHQLMAVQVHMATEAAMSVLTKAWAAMPLAASAEPPLKPNQPNQKSPVPRPTKATLCGSGLLARSELAAPDDPDRGQSRKAGARVHHHAAGEVEHAPLGQEAAAPDPVHEGHVDEEAPDDEELEVALEVDPVGKGAR